MLFKSRALETSLERRFRPTGDVFAFRKEGDLHVAEIRAGAERAVDIFAKLVEEMPAVVSLSLECLRTRREYIGGKLQRAEVRETIARLKVPLAASGGVEISVYTADEQVALSAMLDPWIFAKSDRWLYLVLGQGLEERAELPERGWTMEREDFTGAPEIVEAVSKAAERLTLALALTR
jgi:hypothetical protein